LFAPDKGVHKKTAYREESRLNHMSRVATMNLMGQRLKALYLIANKVAIKGPDLPLLASNLGLYQTPKGLLCSQNSRSIL
jgi:hypothetical protein